MANLNEDRMHKAEFLIAVAGIALIGFVSFMPLLSVAFPILALAGLSTAVLLFLNGERTTRQLLIALGYLIAAAGVGASLTLNGPNDGRVPTVILMVFGGFFIALISAALDGFIRDRRSR